MVAVEAEDDVDVDEDVVVDDVIRASVDAMVKILIIY